MTGLSWRRLVGALGAEATAEEEATAEAEATAEGGDAGAGVDVRRLDPAQVRHALLEQQLIVFRDQSLSVVEFAEFASQLGRLERYPFAEPLAGSEHVVAIVKEAEDAHNFGGAWHTDTSYLPSPPAVTLLYAVEVPDEGGDTLFADMYRAYDSLSAGMQRCLATLRGHNTASLVHDSSGAYASVAGGSVPAKSADLPTCADHPVVRVHPETGKAALYLSLIHTERFVGMTRSESLPLLDQLQSHAISAENCSRLRWAKGTLAIWDNRCVMHFPLNDYPGERREMWRIILAGDPPIGLAESLTSSAASPQTG